MLSHALARQPPTFLRSCRPFAAAPRTRARRTPGDDQRSMMPATTWYPNPAPYPPQPPTDWPVPPPPAPPGGPIPPTPPERPGRRGAAIVIAAVAAAVALIAVIVAGARVAGMDDRRVLTTEPATVPYPTSTSTTSPARRLDSVLPDLISFVERTRGLRFLTRPVVTPLDEATFDRRLAAAQDQDLGEIDSQAVTWRALGLITPSTDLRQAYQAAMQAGVLGFYDPSSKALYVQGETITPLREAVIVHELTHALDDQRFDLQRLDRVKDPDAGAAFLALVEGSSKRVETAYRATFSPDDAAEAQREEAALGSGVDPLTLSLPLVVTLMAPYELGEKFVDALVAKGGTGALDAAFRSPPTTTEQIDQPAKYLAREAALPVAVAGPSEKVVEQGTFGELEVRVLLFASDPFGSIDPSTIDPGQLDQFQLSALLPAITTWGGGRFVSWQTSDGRSCVRFAIVEQGGSAIKDKLSGWVARDGGRLSTGPNGELVGDRCA
ncbi:MAG: hypothetical protein HYX34_14730 [Actinobacteria bacterium]|nr:hypothetical protein [Actinomycetota bacterium]